MKNVSLPKYSELSLVLSETTFRLPPSQVHGVVCGILCGQPDSKTGWEELVTGDKPPTAAHELLQTLYETSAKQLSDFLFEFELILPPDSHPLAERAEALTLWCQGILTGLKLVQVQIVDREPSEFTEAINDFIEIAKMNYEEVVANEEDEEAYTELVEYVRVAVMLVYEELKEETQPKKPGGLAQHLH